VHDEETKGPGVAETDMRVPSPPALLERARKRIPMPARRRVAAWRVNVRRPTSRIRGLPDLLIIGAQRGGTSSLYKYLGQHPDVRPSVRKETEYFSIRYVEGHAWYRSHFPIRPLFSAGRQLTFEATPDYMLHPLAAERAVKLVPDALIIAMLRDPVARAYSQYQHNRRLGHEDLSFEDAIATERERVQGDLERLRVDATYPVRKLRRFGYVERGKYEEQLMRWMSLFPRRRVHVVRSEDFFSSTSTVFEEILAFLGLRPFAPAQFSNYSLRQLTETRANGASTESQELTPSLEDELRAIFAPHCERLYQMLGRDFGWQ
jgi:hypothetical protein